MESVPFPFACAGYCTPGCTWLAVNDNYNPIGTSHSVPHAATRGTHRLTGVGVSCRIACKLSLLRDKKKIKWCELLQTIPDWLFWFRAQLMMGYNAATRCHTPAARRVARRATQAGYAPPRRGEGRAADLGPTADGLRWSEAIPPHPPQCKASSRDKGANRSAIERNMRYSPDYISDSFGPIPVPRCRDIWTSALELELDCHSSTPPYSTAPWPLFVGHRSRLA